MDMLTQMKNKRKTESKDKLVIVVQAYDRIIWEANHKDLEFKTSLIYIGSSTPAWATGWERDPVSKRKKKRWAEKKGQKEE